MGAGLSRCFYRLHELGQYVPCLALQKDIRVRGKGAGLRVDIHEKRAPALGAHRERRGWINHAGGSCDEHKACGVRSGNGGFEVLDRLAETDKIRTDQTSTSRAFRERVREPLEVKILKACDSLPCSGEVDFPVWALFFSTGGAAQAANVSMEFEKRLGASGAVEVIHVLGDDCGKESHTFHFHQGKMAGIGPCLFQGVEKGIDDFRGFFRMGGENGEHAAALAFGIGVPEPAGVAVGADAAFSGYAGACESDAGAAFF